MTTISLTRPILFMDILTGDPAMRQILHRQVYRGNTYAESMRQALNVTRQSFVVLDASAGNFPDNLFRFSGIIIGGSTEDPIRGQEKSWVRRTYPFLRRAVRSNIPILGICGGLEFVVRALGGEIIRNPKGREFGSSTITLTRAGQRDPLFYRLPVTCVLQSSHTCIAKAMIHGGKMLATNQCSKLQAMAIGENVRLLQFHLEMRRVHIVRLAKLRREKLLSERFIQNERAFKKFLTSIDETLPVGRAIFKNWIDYFVVPRL